MAKLSAHGKELLRIELEKETPDGDLTLFESSGQTCTTCGKPVDRPYRRYDSRGTCVEGCVDSCHTGHLVTASESSCWHNRPEAKKIRAALERGRKGIGYDPR